MRVAVASLAGIPLYDGDVETAQGIPAPVTSLKDRVADSDGVLLVTPEYNGSLPGVFKNALDWMSRPTDDSARVFKDRAVAVMGATPGGTGTRMSQTAWLPVIRALGMRPWWGMSMFVGGAFKLFDDQGRLTDEKTRERLAEFVAGFAEFALQP